MTNYEYDELCSCVSHCTRYGLDAIERQGDGDVHRIDYGVDFFGECKFTDGNATISVDRIKPLLRPMSDITEKEMEHIKKITGCRDTFSYNSNYYSFPLPIAQLVIEYLDSRFLDYRDLIGLGNAVPVRHDHYFQGWILYRYKNKRNPWSNG